MDNINLNSLKIFLIVATSNSFLEASNKLYISQPAISKAINKLEEDLGITLFYRANKGVSLTSNGEILLKYVRDSQKLLLACDRMLSANNNADAGSIIIGAQSHVVRNYLLEHIEHFRKQYPAVHVVIKDLSTLGLIEALEKHEVDFVIDASPIITPYNNITIKPISKLKTCFIKCRELEKSFKSLKDLENECLIMPVYRSSLRKNLEKVLDEHNVELKPMLEYETEELIIESVRHNMGIGYVVNGKSIEISKNDIDVIDPEEDLPKIEINLVYIENYITELDKHFINNELLNDLQEHV